MEHDREGKVMSDEDVNSIEDEDTFIKEMYERFEAQGHPKNAIRSFIFGCLSIDTPKTLMRVKVAGVERTVVVTPIDIGFEIHWMHVDDTLPCTPTDSNPNMRIIDGNTLKVHNTVQ